MSNRAKIETAAEASERRAGDRIQITVSAEVLEIKSGTKFSSRTTDLGIGGCFVDCLMPLPVGSNVRVLLRRDVTSFEAAGTVTFSQTGLGMGIAFCDLAVDKLAALEAWLIELGAEKPHGYEAPRTSAVKHSQPSSPTHALVVRLVRLLVSRGLVSEGEASALLRETLP